jgi:hypothetical protein
MWDGENVKGDEDNAQHNGSATGLRVERSETIVERTQGKEEELISEVSWPRCLYDVFIKMDVPHSTFARKRECGHSEKCKGRFWAVGAPRELKLGKLE